MKELLGIAAIGIAFVAYIPYFRDILSRRTIPHPYSWFVWGISSFLIFALQLTNGGGPGSYVTGVITAICIAIGLLALRNGAYREIKRQDTVLFVVALAAAVLWLFIDQPVLAIILLVSSDFIAIIPSVRKAWYKPYEETMSMWAINGVRHGVAIAALVDYNIITLLDPIVWIGSNFLFVALLVARRRAIRPPRRRKQRRHRLK